MNGRTLIISLLLVTGAASADQTAVFNEAKSFGQSQTQGVYNATKSGVSAGTIPGYGTTPLRRSITKADRERFQPQAWRRYKTVPPIQQDQTRSPIRSAKR